MKPLSVDLSAFERFEFDNPPVGVKFLLFKPDGIGQIEGRMPLCAMAKEAANRARPFYATQDNESCFGAVALGMADTPSFAQAGQIGEGLEIFDDARANTRIYEYLPKLHRGTVNYVVFAALNSLTFDPDLLMVTANTRQAEIILRAMSFKTGEIRESRTTGVFGCAWLYAYPYKSGKVNFTPTGLAFGTKAKEIYPEGLMLISIPWDWLPVISSSLKEMKWELPSYVQGREEFLKHEEALLASLAQRSINP
jgi:uncharacterized protein (DUF169 family)